MKHLTMVAAAILLASAPVLRPAQADELRLAHFVSPQHPYHAAFEWLGEALAAETAGELTLRVFPGGELGSNAADYVTMTVEGITDLAFILPGYTPAQFPRTLVMELPGVLDDPDAGPDGYRAAADLVAGDFRRVVPLSLWTNAFSAIFTRGRPVESLADLQGLKIRVASAPMSDLVAAWGATPVFMPVTELYTALQTGVVDGAVIDPGAALVFRLSEVTDAMTIGWRANVGTFGLIMNRDRYGDLPDAQREILTRLAAEVGDRSVAAWGNLAERGIAAFAGIDGHRVITLTPDAAAEFDALSDQVREAEIAELEAAGIPGIAILAAMRGQ